MRKLFFGIVASIVISSPVYAFNLSFLQDSPVYYFTKSDWAISENASMRALNSAPDNTRVNWANPQTNAHGYFMPFNSTMQNGVRCRKMRIVSVAHEITGQSVYQFCKMNGDWKILN